jgi:hypothetical protein
VKCIRRLGDDYAHTLAALLVLGLVLVRVRVLGPSCSPAPLLLSRWLAELLDTLVLFTMAHVLGLLLYTRGDAIGYGPRATTSCPVAQAPSTDMRRHLPVPVALGPPRLGAGAPRPSCRSSPRRWRAETWPKALTLYRPIPLAPAAIPAALHLFVGQAAATQGRLRPVRPGPGGRGGCGPGGPPAPRALVLLARVLGERMQERHRARTSTATSSRGTRRQRPSRFAGAAFAHLLTPALPRRPGVHTPSACSGAM